MTDESIATTSNEVLEHEVVALAGQIASATCRFLVLVAELDRRNVWAGWGCRSMAHWLSWRCSLSPVTAREHVRVAHALRSLPLTVEAFGRGELSYSKVRVLTRVITSDTEHDLVELARTATAAQLEKIVRASVVAMADPEAREAMRELFMTVDDEGFGTTRVRLTIDQHAVVEQAIAKALPVESDSAGALPTRRADAWLRICESYLAHGDASRTPPTRNNAVVHVEVDASGVTGGETEAGVPVHAETCRRILCDASVQGMLGHLGLPIGVGRTTRTISRKMRRALKRRSGGQCEWIGCEERLYVEGHHVVHWEHGGPTDLSNLVNLCWHHHHLVHEGGWRLDHDGRDEVRCFRPDGSELFDPMPTPVSDRLDLTAADEAIVPLWAGETFDLSACVGAVLSTRDQARPTVRA